MKNPKEALSDFFVPFKNLFFKKHSVTTELF